MYTKEKCASRIVSYSPYLLFRSIPTHTSIQKILTILSVKQKQKVGEVIQFPKFIPEKRYFLLPDTKLNFDLKILIALIEEFFRRNALKWEHFLFHLCNCRHNKLRQCLLTGHALGIRICGCSLFYKRELWASKSAGAHSTKSLKISGCKRWYPKDLRVPAPAAPTLTHSLTKEVCNGGVACSPLAADKPRPPLQNSLVFTYLMEISNSIKIELLASLSQILLLMMFTNWLLPESLEFRATHIKDSKG